MRSTAMMFCAALGLLLMVAEASTKELEKQIQSGWMGRSVYLMIPLNRIRGKGFLNIRTVELRGDQDDDYPRGVTRMEGELFFDRFRVRKYELRCRELRLTLSRPAYYAEIGAAFRNRIDVVVKLTWDSEVDYRRLNEILASVIVPEDGLPPVLRFNGDGPRLLSSPLVDATVPAAVESAQAELPLEPARLFGPPEVCMPVPLGADSLNLCWWKDYQVLGVFRGERALRLLYVRY